MRFSPASVREFIRKGKGHPDQRVSTTYPLEPNKLASLLTTLTPSLPDVARDAILRDGDTVVQFAVVIGNEVKLFTRPRHFHGSDGLSYVVGSLSNNLGDPAPVRFPLMTFSGHFTSLIPASVVDEFNLPRSTQPPDDIPGPAPPGAPEGDGEGASMERLHFGSTDTPDQHPVLAALPFFLPWPEGKLFPTMFKLDDPPSADIDYPAFDMWRAAFRYIKEHNDGNSVTKGGPLFQQDAVDQNVPDWVHLFIVPGIIHGMTTCEYGTASYIIVRDSFNQLCEERWLYKGAALSEAPHETPPPRAVPPGEDPFATPQAGRPHLSRKEQEQADLALDFARRYGICFGAIVDVDEGAGHPTRLFQQATMSAAGSKLLNATREVSAHRHLREMVGAALSDASHSTNCIDEAVSLTPTAANPALASALRTYNFLTDPVTTNSKQVRNQITLFNFLSPDQTALVYKTLETEEIRMYNAFSHDDVKVVGSAPKPSALYIHGRLATGHDVRVALCNFRAVFSQLLGPTFDTSALWKELGQYEALLRSPQGKKWIDVCRVMPQVALNVAIDIQNIISAFAALGNRPEYHTALAADEAISSKLFDVPKMVSQGILRNLRIAMSKCVPTEYSVFPAVYTLFFGGTATPTASSPYSDVTTKRARVDHQSSGPPRPPPQHQTPGQRPPSATSVDKMKKLGLVIYSGTGRAPPTCPVFHSTGAGRPKERLCMNFLCQGFACTKKDCKRPHIAALAKLSDTEQAELATFVSRDPTFALR